MEISEMVQISEQVAQKMSTTAHKFDHADRVRKWVVKIARSEKLSKEQTSILELASLWHDVGLDYVLDRHLHADKSAEMFLDKFKGLANDLLLDKVAFAVRNHDKFDILKNKKIDQEKYLLLRILMDADTLDLLGESGFDRGIESAREKDWPKFDIKNPLGRTFGFSAEDFTKRMNEQKSGVIKSFIEPTQVGQLNFQISCADLLFTSFAKSEGSKGKKYLKNKIQEITKNT